MISQTGKHGLSRFSCMEATLSGYPGTVRQLVVTGLGREAPTVIITNDRAASAKQLIERYARRMNIEQRLAEDIAPGHVVGGGSKLLRDCGVVVQTLAVGLDQQRLMLDQDFKQDRVEQAKRRVPCGFGQVAHGGADSAQVQVPPFDSRDDWIARFQVEVASLIRVGL